MLVNATYEDGAIRITQPLRFKHRKFELVVNIPEAEIDVTEERSVSSKDMVEKNENTDDPAHRMLMSIRQILGPYARQRPATSVEQDKAVYLEALQEKYSR